MKKTRVIGLGNTILTDDGVGCYVAREVRARLADRLGPDLDVVETEVAGLTMMELMTDWERVILVDAIQFNDTEPGTVVQIDPMDLRTSLRLRSVHDIDLPTVLQMGPMYGFSMPDEVIIFGIQGEDTLTLGEKLTPTIAAVMPDVVERVLVLVDQEG